MAKRDPLVNLPADVAGFIREKHPNREVIVSPLPYWSTTRVACARAAGPPVVLSVAAGTQVTAFSYGLNGDMGAAGRAGVLAARNDTNLQIAGQTRDNSDVFIWGLAAHIKHDSEGEITRRLVGSMDFQISTNGSVMLPLGTLEMFPAGGGLYGASNSFILEPDLATPGAVDGGPGGLSAFSNNGNPMSGNFFRLPQPILWSGVGGGGSDNTLQIIGTVDRALSITCSVARAAAAGVSAYTPPAAAGDDGTFMDVRWRLICVAVTPRSVNA